MTVIKSRRYHSDKNHKMGMLASGFFLPFLILFLDADWVSSQTLLPVAVTPSVFCFIFRASLCLRLL